MDAQGNPVPCPVDSEPKGSEGSSLDELCQCGHSRLDHQEPEGSYKGQCDACFNSLSKRLDETWIHAFVPAAGETAGEPEDPKETRCEHTREGGCCSGPGYCAHACGMPPEPEAPEGAGCVSCGMGIPRGCTYCEDCVPRPEPPRRPPYAVAYEIEGGGLFEIALPGDATVRMDDGVLIVMHTQGAVKALVQARPMEGQ
jgi:hypothetical protein